jgi:hypothetical protein
VFKQVPILYLFKEPLAPLLKLYFFDLYFFINFTLAGRGVVQPCRQRLR